MQYTTEQYIAELEKRKKTINKAKIIFGCASSTHNAQIKRMWDASVNANNEPLVNNYSTKPFYLSPYSSPKGIKPVGKTGRTTFKTGKAHKTQYLSGGYKQFKTIIGRPFFEVFGQLKQDFTNSLTLRGESYTTGVKTDLSEQKYRNLIKKYGRKSFMLTKDEKTNYSNCINRKLNNILRGETANV